jgi:prepilin-type N-terminal cleavage/methylation domain-containing protein/prepilin-type processing-associated H-X9-DG protein
MKRRSLKRGFTLIELLVVIAIIAMLMSILMPALSKAKDQATAVICRTRLKQWGLIYHMYFEEHNGKVPPGRYGTVNPLDESGWGVWFRATEGYYNDPTLMFCPATKSKDKGASPQFASWHLSNPWIDLYPQFQNGSYCYNMWGVAKINGRHGGPTSQPDRDHQEYRIYNVSELREAGNTPLMADGMRFQDWPEANDAPPETEDEVFGDRSRMGRFCVNRHNKTTNMVFFDGAVHRVGLKSLWQFKWHLEFNKRGDWTPSGGVTASDWPEWMRQYPEYLVN